MKRPAPAEETVPPPMSTLASEGKAKSHPPRRRALNQVRRNEGPPGAPRPPIPGGEACTHGAADVAELREAAEAHPACDPTHHGLKAGPGPQAHFDVDLWSVLHDEIREPLEGMRRPEIEEPAPPSTVTARPRCRHTIVTSSAPSASTLTSPSPVTSTIQA